MLGLRSTLSLHPIQRLATGGQLLGISAFPSPHSSCVHPFKAWVWVGQASSCLSFTIPLPLWESSFGHATVFSMRVLLELLQDLKERLHALQETASRLTPLDVAASQRPCCSLGRAASWQLPPLLLQACTATAFSRMLMRDCTPSHQRLCEISIWAATLFTACAATASTEC